METNLSPQYQFLSDDLKVIANCHCAHMLSYVIVLRDCCIYSCLISSSAEVVGTIMLRACSGERRFPVPNKLRYRNVPSMTSPSIITLALVTNDILYNFNYVKTC